MKQSLTITASSLRLVLGAVLFLIIVLAAVGFYFAEQTLSSYAKETSVLNSEVNASTQNISALQHIQQYLDEHQDDVQRASDVVAESKQYRYQDEIVRDITSFANKSGVRVLSFDFSDVAGATGSRTPTPNTATGKPAPTSAAPSGVTPATVVVSIDQPVNYDNLLDFIHRIESNVTRMQIANISITRTVNDGAVSLSVNSFNIEVYLRK